VREGLKKPMQHRNRAGLRQDGAASTEGEQCRKRGQGRRALARKWGGDPGPTSRRCDREQWNNNCSGAAEAHKYRKMKQLKKKKKNMIKDNTNKIIGMIKTASGMGSSVRKKQLDTGEYRGTSNQKQPKTEDI